MTLLIDAQLTPSLARWVLQTSNLVEITGVFLKTT